MNEERKIINLKKLIMKLEKIKLTELADAKLNEREMCKILGGELRGVVSVVVIMRPLEVPARVPTTVRTIVAE